MSLNEATSRRQTRITYIVVGTVVVVLLIAALVSYRSDKATDTANQKAAQLQSELQAEGLRVPSTDMLVRVLGDDGGATCADPNEALQRGVLYGMLTNGAGGPGIRPIITDKRLVRGQLLIIKVYCPQYLEDFTEFVDDLKSADVVKG
jgi:hypothetical protein